MHYLNFDWGVGEQPGTPLPPCMCPCLSDTSVLDRATGHMGHLVKEAVERPGEHENMNTFMVSH